MLHSKKGAIAGVIRTLNSGTVILFIGLSLVATYIINFLLNQIFGTRLIPIGQPVRFFIIITAMVVVFMLLVNKRASLDRIDIFTILLIGIGSGLLVVYLPKFIPELFSSFPLLESAYTNHNSPIYIWNNATSTAVATIQSIVFP